MAAVLRKADVISDTNSMEMHKEANMHSCDIYNGKAGVEGDVPEFKKGPCIASKESGAVKTQKKTKV